MDSVQCAVRCQRCEINTMSDCSILNPNLFSTYIRIRMLIDAAKTIQRLCARLWLLCENVTSKSGTCQCRLNKFFSRAKLHCTNSPNNSKLIRFISIPSRLHLVKHTPSRIVRASIHKFSVRLFSFHSAMDSGHITRVERSFHSYKYFNLNGNDKLTGFLLSGYR